MYQLTKDGGIRRVDMYIPADSSNIHYQDYLKWVADGNTARPAPPAGMKAPVWNEPTNSWIDDPAEQEGRSIRNAARARLRQDRANGGPMNPRQMWSLIEDLLEANPGLLNDE